MYKYRVEFWDEVEGIVTYENGVTDGGSYSEAADHISDYYGVENLMSMKLEELDTILLDDDLKNMFDDEVEKDESDG